MGLKYDSVYNFIVVIGYSLAEDSLVKLTINIKWCREEASIIVSCLVKLLAVEQSAIQLMKYVDQG